MSLLLHRRAIRQSALGALSAARERRLRAHLVGCADCRREYDRMALLAEASGEGRRLAATARTRLLDALPSAEAVGSPGRRRVPLLVLPALVVAAAAALMLVRRPPAPEEIRWRGGASAPDDTVRAGLVLRAYASRRGDDGSPGPVRLVGELPGSGELRLATGDLLQLAYAGLSAPRTVAVFAAAAGAPIPCWPRPAAASLPLLPAAEGRPIGRSLEIAGLGLGGRARLIAVVATRTLAAAEADAAARAALAGRPSDDDTIAVLMGTLIVEP